MDSKMSLFNRVVAVVFFVLTAACVAFFLWSFTDRGWIFLVPGLISLTAGLILIKE